MPFFISPTEAVFLPGESAEVQPWIDALRAQGFTLWDEYSSVCTRVRMVPADLAERIAELEAHIKAVE